MDGLRCPENIEHLSCSGKQQWPEVVGKAACMAASVIERENSKVNVFVLPDGIPVTGDFRCDRVRVFINHNGLVVRTPVVT